MTDEEVMNLARAIMYTAIGCADECFYDYLFLLDNTEEEDLDPKDMDRIYRQYDKLIQKMYGVISLENCKVEGD